MSTDQSVETLPQTAAGEKQHDGSQLYEDSEKRKSVEEQTLPVEPAKDPYLVTELESTEEPLKFSMKKKVMIMAVVSLGALCSTCTSSMAAFAEGGIMRDFHVSKEVSVLSISLYVVGLGIGPLLVGPLSEVYGRRPIYQTSYILFWIFSWPVAFAPNIAVHLVFRFLTGFFSSAFLSVAGGTVGDLFVGPAIAIATAIYALSPFIGPMLGPLVSGFINQHTNWRWTFRVLIIWIFVECVLIYFFVPETYKPVLLRQKAHEMRKTTGDSRYEAQLDRNKEKLSSKIIVSCYRPFQLLAFDQMNLLLDLWASFAFAILYLAFQAFPFIFMQKHHFDIQSTGLSFIGIGIGMTTGCISNVFLILYAFRTSPPGAPPAPERSLIPGMLGAIIVPLSLYWLAFTTYSHVHWIAPIIASVFFGAGFLLCFSSVLSYLVQAYRPVAASSMAANAFVRSVLAAAFPLFSDQMYTKLGTVGATALLAGLMTITAPLPFIFFRIGARLRAKSRFTSFGH